MPLCIRTEVDNGVQHFLNVIPLSLTFVLMAQRGSLPLVSTRTSPDRAGSNPSNKGRQSRSIVLPMFLICSYGGGGEARLGPE